jgi:hypothetical protein
VKRLLIDVNVVLDALLARPRHSDAASRLWIAVESKQVEAMVPAHGVTTLFTHDPKGFRGCALPVLSAETAVALVAGAPPGRVGERLERPRPGVRRRRNQRRGAGASSIA